MMLMWCAAVAASRLLIQHTSRTEGGARTWCYTRRLGARGHRNISHEEPLLALRDQGLRTITLS